MNVRTLTLGTALSLCVALPVCAQDAPGVDTVVATVGGTDITLGHMIALRERLPQQYSQLPDAALFDGLLAQLINQEALAQRAEGGSARVDLVLDNERRALVANGILQSIAESAVTEEAIAQAYDDAYGDAGPTTEWNASHILLETEEEAAAVKEELDAGGDFAGLARERSTGPSAPNGGSLGWFGPGMMVPPFEETVAALQPGEVSDPFQTDFGWHVAKLNEVRASDAPSLEEVHEEIAAQVQQQALEAAVAAATDGVEVVRPDISGIDPNMLSNSSLID
jgi:peptidyl-prolyl cis-trans isomerase C